MESRQLIKEFYENAKQVSICKGDEQHRAIEWMNKFAESENAVPTCLEILNNSPDDEVKVQTVKVLQHLIKISSASFHENDALDLYRFLMGMLETVPNIQLTNQISVCLGILLSRTALWTSSFTQILVDLLSIVPNESRAAGFTEDPLFSKKLILIIFRETFLDLTASQNRYSAEIRTKFENEEKTISHILVDLLKCFQDNPLCLKQTVEVCRKAARVCPSHHFLNSNVFLTVCELLHKSEPENDDCIYPLVKYITSCVSDFELTNGDDTRSRYRCCSSLVQDLRIIADAAIQRMNKDLVHSIAYIMTTLADKLFETYINSDYEIDFSFLDELAHICELQDIEIYNMATKFWRNFENHLHLSDKPKFKVFSDKYCDIFANQMFEALFISEPIMIEYMKSQKDDFVAVFRENVHQCLKTIIKLISPQPYLGYAMTILQTDLKDYYQVEPCIFYVRAMINNTVFPVDSYEVLRIILNFKPHAPSLLIKTSCEFLKDFIDHCENTRNGIQIPGTTFDSIYKWLSQVSVPASQVIMHVGASRKDMVSDNISDCKYLNNILVLCRESNEMTRLARLIGKIIKTTGENDAVLVLQTVLNFHKERVRKQMEYKNDSSESALITIFHMSALSMIMETMGYVNVTFNHLFVTVTETIFLLYDVMKHFTDNENVWESVCNVLVHLFRLSQLYDYNRECLSFFLHDLFEKSPFSSIIVLARIYRNNIWVKYFEEDYISQTCYIIRNETCKFLADKDLNDYPRLIERIMQLLNSILGSAYEDYIDDETTSRLIEFAPQGLLLDNEQAFLECNKLLIELFAHPSISFCTKNRRKVKSHLMGFYDLLIEEIVKNCIDVILSKRNVFFVKTCGNMLRIMKTTERRLIGTHMNIAEDLIYRIWAACPERISSQQRIVDALLKILSASSKEIAEGLAVSLNSKL